MLPVHIRWMIQRDHSAVAKIEKASFEYPWSEKDFVLARRPKDRIGFVAEHSEIVVGYMIVEVQPRCVRLINMAVHPGYRRQKVGSQLIDHIGKKYLDQRHSRCHVELEIRETNLGGQLFFKNKGFRAVATINGLYQETKEDAYLMKLGKFASVKNRIKDYMPEQFRSELDFSA
jgi:ribosomal-protein-alanine N-acetyltransferase